MSSDNMQMNITEKSTSSTDTTTTSTPVAATDTTTTSTPLAATDTTPTSTPVAATDTTTTPTPPQMRTRQPGEQPQQPPDEKRVDLLTIDVANENVALNVLVGFIGIAQRRGAFAINEAAKIHECIKAFGTN